MGIPLDWIRPAPPGWGRRLPGRAGLRLLRGRLRGPFHTQFSLKQGPCIDPAMPWGCLAPEAEGLCALRACVHERPDRALAMHLTGAAMHLAPGSCRDARGPSRRWPKVFKGRAPKPSLHDSRAARPARFPSPEAPLALGARPASRRKGASPPLPGRGRRGPFFCRAPPRAAPGLPLGAFRVSRMAPFEEEGKGGIQPAALQSHQAGHPQASRSSGPPFPDTLYEIRQTIVF
jgi:hypothetical protein